MMLSSSSSGLVNFFKLTIHDKISIVGYDRSILFNTITQYGDTAKALAADS